MTAIEFGLRFRSSDSIIQGMSQSFHLFQLQKIDTQLDKFQRRLDEINQALENDPALVAAEQKLHECSLAHHKARHALMEIEENVRARQIKMQLSESNLYSGRINNPKELQDLQNEIASLKRQITALEDQQLEAMLAFENAQQSLDTAQNDHKQAQAHASSQNAMLAGEREDLLRTRDRLDKERRAIIAQITPSNLEHYQNLRRQKHGLAVAGVDANSCSICGGSLTPSEWQAARSPNTIMHCPTCGRILYAG